MPRNRTIKPGFFTDERLAALSIPAMLLYVGLWCHVDDAGHIGYQPAHLGAWIFPRR